ncbi:mannose-6-phosphate isomerase, class I [Streptomyces lavendofoliae]|uniref:mannose-6-phosphate isomerase n=1 Tax=Streptomyces lavendofoliae TaxID=67314 RepID=A0A918M5Y0_9ACTN|nr:mannose-6-phosphate isomerase, class I [Streptomyces lavendofoliae]GGU46772.1 mannose-6-phosphate isomerase, class I [Streptomyces lavendofoliae]
MDLLTNTVQPYAWGSTTALPELMGTPPTGEPQAELWMGAHPAAPSRVERDGHTLPLDRVIAADPARELGSAGLRRFGPRLPFLLKLLAADAPLSLQVHPDLAQAAAGFAVENALGVPVDAPHRNYRDGHHKPEMIVALTPFDGLCGFRAPRGCADLLDRLDVPGLRPFGAALRDGDDEAALREVFTAFLSPPAGLVGEVTGAVAREAAREGPHRADLGAYLAIARAHPGDPGLLGALMLRYVRLAPGEALHLGAGVPHAYLSGLGVEIMASSDNVLRCGLTSKHVDPDELLKVVRFSALPTPVLVPRAEGDEQVYPAPVDDFRLSRLVLTTPLRPRPLAPGAPQILLCTQGEAHVASAGASLTIGPGRAVYVPAWERVAVSGRGTVFRATVAVPGDRPNDTGH